MGRVQLSLWHMKHNAQHQVEVGDGGGGNKLPSKNSGTLMECDHMNERQANHGVAWSNEKEKKT